MFVEAAQSVLDNVINGFNGTIFAYGQTGMDLMDGMGWIANSQLPNDQVLAKPIPCLAFQATTTTHKVA